MNKEKRKVSDRQAGGKEERRATRSDAAPNAAFRVHSGSGGKSRLCSAHSVRHTSSVTFTDISKPLPFLSLVDGAAEFSYFCFFMRKRRSARCGGETSDWTGLIGWEAAACAHLRLPRAGRSCRCWTAGGQCWGRAARPPCPPASASTATVQLNSLD